MKETRLIATMIWVVLFGAAVELLSKCGGVVEGVEVCFRNLFKSLGSFYFFQSATLM